MPMKHILMESASDGASGGTAGGGAPAGSGPAGQAPAGAVQAQAGAPAAPSLLAAGAGAADPFGWLPEKYRVVGDDKALNLDASARKLAEAYTGLEKRLGEVGMPPKSADEYKPEGLPETVNVAEIMQDEGTKAFLKRCHAKGMTNAQVSEVLAFGLAEWAPKLLQSDQADTVEAATAALREHWTDEAAFQENVRLGFKATAAAAKKAGLSFEDVERAGLGNNPMFVRIMAALGPEIGEDKSPANALPGEEQTIRDLEASDAYKDPKHARHEQVSAQIRAYYQRRYPGTAE